MRSQNIFFRLVNSVGLVTQIVIGLILAAILAYLSPSTAQSFGILGDIFVRALRAVAPILVLLLVASAIANHKQGQKSNMKLNPLIIAWYL